MNGAGVEAIPAISQAPFEAPSPPPDPVCDPQADLRPDALPAPAFQQAVLAALGATAGVTAAGLGPFRIQVTYRGPTGGVSPGMDVGGDAVDAEVRLDAWFKDYRHGRVEVADVVGEIRAGLRLPGAGALAAGPFPRLARRGTLDATVFARPCPFDPDLVVFYVRELAHSHVPLTRADVDLGWPDADALHAEALAKLGERTRRVPADSQGEGTQLVIGYNSGDGFDAARALLPDLMRALAAWLPGRMHVALPTRDLLFAVGDADPEFLAGARAHARESFAAGAERLSPAGYVLGEAGLVRDGEPVG